MDNNQEGNKAPTAFLVDLVSNRKIPVATPRCRVGRDDLNDIVISGDQSISRFHFIISYENSEFTVQDAKSRHGTFLNGNQLTVSESIKDGDVLKVGVSLFWFVVEGAQTEAGEDAGPTKVGATSETDSVLPNVLTTGSGSATKTSGDLESTMMPTALSQDPTQEMKRPDSGLMDKLEKAANSIKIDEKPTETKTSLASLLADAREPEPEPEPEPEADKKKEELAALAARDKELLSAIADDTSSNSLKENVATESSEPNSESTAVEPSEPAEETNSAESTDKNPESPVSETTDTAPEAEVEANGSSPEITGAAEAMPEAATAADTASEDSTNPEEVSEGFKEGEIPARPTNKPSDTVTLEALMPHSAAQAETAESESPNAEEPVAETQEADFVSKSNDSDNKSENTEIIDSTPAVEETLQSEDKSSAETLQASLPETVLSTPEASAEAASDKEAEVSPETETEKATPQLTVETMSVGHESSSGSNGAGTSSHKADRAEETSQALTGQTQNKVSPESQDLEITKFIKAGASAVPDWCKRYFSDEIAKLNSELDDLNEQVKLAQQKIRDVETRVAMTRGIRNTLLTTTGDELVEACGKVLSLLGWKVTISAEDKHELRLEVEDKHICIARVIWTTTKAERSHLGQLSISQTRYWMEKGVEPKGIIIVSKISGEPPTAVGDSPEEVELNDYAAKRNVCLMSTLQLLSLYKEIALADASPDKLRTSIVNASGWLSGHNLEPGTTEPSEDEPPVGQPSNKLSSLLSA